MDESSEILPPKALDIFEMPQKACGLERIEWVDFRPIAPLGRDQPVEFILSGSGHQYLDLKRTFLHIKVSVTRPNGEPLKDGDDVAPVNLWMHSLFAQCDVTAQQKLLYNSGTLYPYKAYIETILNTPGSEYSGLVSELFYKDTANAMDVLPSEKTSDTNAGMRKRRAACSHSKTIDMIGPIHADMCQIDRLLLNGVDVSIKLYPSKTAFNLMSSDKYASIYKINIKEAVLKACKVTVDPAIIAAHAAVLSRGITAKYPLMKSELKSFVIPQGQLSFYQGDLFQNKIPAYLVLGIVSAKAFQGDYVSNPFNFSTFDLSNLSVYIDGQSVPFKPLTLNFGGNEFMHAYHNLIGESSSQCGITLDDFKGGYALYVYRLADSTYEKCSPQDRSGNLSLDATFRTPLPQSVNIILYAKFPALLQIDQFRSIML